MGVAEGREGDLVPGGADGMAGVVEAARHCRLGETDQRDGIGNPGAAVTHVGDELFQACPRRRQDLGDAFGARPAQPAVPRRALAFVERGGIQARPPRQSRRGKAVFPGQTVDGAPDVRMGEHGNMFI